MEAISIRLAKYHHFLHVCYTLPLLSYHCPFLSTDWLVCLHLNFFLPMIGQPAKAPPLRLQTVWLKIKKTHIKLSGQSSTIKIVYCRLHLSMYTWGKNMFQLGAHMHVLPPNIRSLDYVAVVDLICFHSTK